MYSEKKHLKRYYEKASFFDQMCFPPISQDFEFFFGTAFQKRQHKYNTVRIMLNHEIAIELPKKLEDMAKSIEVSKYILKLEDNWDDEGSKKYDFAKWERAVRFLAESSVWIYERILTVIPSPKIYHGPSGSIDMLWKKSDHNLLINFPENSEESASFYGESSAKEEINGSFDPTMNNPHILMFLLRK